MQVKKYLKILPKNQLLANNDRKKLLRESTMFRSIFLCFCPAILSKLLLSWLSLEYILCGLTYFTADDKFGSIQNMFRFNLKVRLFVPRSFRQFPISSSICQVIPACKFKVSCQNLFPCGNHPSWFLVKVLSFGMLPAAKVKVYVTRNEGQQSTCISYGKVSKRLQDQRKLGIAFWPVPRPRNLSRNWKVCIDYKKWSLTSPWMSYGKVAPILQKSKEIWELRSCMCQDQRSFPWRNFTLITRNVGQRVLECRWKSCHKITEEQRNLWIAFVRMLRPKDFSKIDMFP